MLRTIILARSTLLPVVHRHGTISHNRNLNHAVRMISSGVARSILGLPSAWNTIPRDRKLDSAGGNDPDDADAMALRELRMAYREAAKRCHPDLLGRPMIEPDHENHHTPNDTNTSYTTTRTNKSHHDFVQVTVAYEFLLSELRRGISSSECSWNRKDDDDDHDNRRGAVGEIPDVQRYRQACLDQLGLPAEIVEECKGNPMFRRWLHGTTDAAQIWRDFFVQQGGLVPILRKMETLEAGDTSGTIPMSQQRRRRKR